MLARLLRNQSRRAGELRELLDPIRLQPLDGEQRNQADQRADAELVEPAVGIAQHVVEEAVLLVPQLIVAAAHVLHGGGDVDVVLEELDRQPLVDAVLLRQLQGDAHQVQAEHPHPAGGVGLFEHDAVGAAFRCGRRR